MNKRTIFEMVILIALVIIAYFATSPFMSKSFMGINEDVDYKEESVRAKIKKIISEEKKKDELSGDLSAEGGQAVEENDTDSTSIEAFNITVQKLQIEIKSGKHKGELAIIENSYDDNIAFKINVENGDDILAVLQENDNGKVTGGYVYNLARDKYLIWLVIAFIICLLVFGGIKGFKSVISLLITLIAVVRVMLPLMLKGYNPIVVSISTCAIATLFTMAIINGFNKKTMNAILGTIGGVLVAGILAYIVGHMAKLTGLDSEEAQMLVYLPQNIKFDFTGLLFAGMIMGALGAVMDIGMSIASAMNEIEQAKPGMTSTELIKSGMNVGRDVMGTMSNTLILAYAGGSIHIIIIFLAYNATLTDIFNMDMIASEVVRALVGSIGLVFTIPITAVISGTFGRQYKKIED